MKIITARETDRSVKVERNLTNGADVYDRITVHQDGKTVQVVKDHESNRCEVWRGDAVETRPGGWFEAILRALGIE
jgi:hypothetical protein